MRAEDGGATSAALAPSCRDLDLVSTARVMPDA
jgi:hypothetical protein